MRGATDGGAHIEALRTGRMRRGKCAFSPGCGCVGRVLLEFHHEKYRPELGLHLSHNCHHRTHFRPWQLSDREKEILLCCRHGNEKYRALAGKPRVFEMLKRRYVAPGRRPAQLEVRRKVREMAESHYAEVHEKRKVRRFLKPAEGKDAGGAAGPGSPG